MLDSKPLSSDATKTTVHSIPYLKIDAKVRAILPDWKELWNYREMLYYLVARDIKIRYRQTILGPAWAIIQPLTSMIVFTFIFGQVAKISSNDIPYPLFSFAALIPWTFFQNSISLATESLVGQAQLVRKVYFPRIYIPLTRILSGIFDVILSLIMLFILMFLFLHSTTHTVLKSSIYSLQIFSLPSFHLSWLAIVVIPVLVALMIVTCLSLGLWMSALNVQYRDIRYLIPYLLQILTFLTPVAYPTNIIAEPARTIYSLNPMVTVIEGFRWVLLGQAPPPLGIALASLIPVIILFITGLLYFNFVEGTFSDVV